MCSLGIDVIKIALWGKRGHYIRYHFQSTTQVHASSSLYIGTCKFWRAKLVKIIGLRIQCTLDIILCLLTDWPVHYAFFTEARDTRVLNSRFAHSRALREVTVLRGLMELWEIHSKWRTQQSPQKRFIQDSLFIWCGFSQIGKYADIHKAV